MDTQFSIYLGFNTWHLTAESLYKQCRDIALYRSAILVKYTVLAFKANEIVLGCATVHGNWDRNWRIYVKFWIEI